MPVVKLTLSYDGTDYHGWQKQPRLPTIQGRMETALYQLTRQRLAVHGAGRTDAGVHALGQVAHFLSDRSFQPKDWIRGINALLPEDIVIRAAEVAKDRFHARHSAKNKQYRYLIRNAELPSPFDRRTKWFLRQTLDVDGMSQAAEGFRGAHVFTSFCAAGAETDDHHVDLKRVDLIQREDEIAVILEAPRFLQYMVRNIVGFLVEVGKGKRGPGEVSDILAAKDRRRAGPTAPSHGLCLMKVDY
ncbi:MAG: tRNA pseudouridine(38-40) synthase TruA [Nitrospiria bacterium]